jgi:hypothetical protein
MKEKFNFNKPKNKLELLNKLNEGVDKIAQQTNEQFGLDLLDNQGVINSSLFSQPSQKKIDFINQRERYWAKVDDPDARKSFATFHHLESLDEVALTKAMFDRWRDEKENGKSTMLEKLTTIIFRKALGKEYLVMRSATYDDYAHGVDNVIINTKTNEIICAFDEVHSRKAGDRLVEKNQKIIKQAQTGGTQIDDAVKMVDGKLAPAQYKNVPNFYITLDIDELNEALDKINCQTINQTSDFEQSLYIKFTSAIIQQSEMLLQQPNIPDIIKQRLHQVSQFFKTQK